MITTKIKTKRFYFCCNDGHEQKPKKVLLTFSDAKTIFSFTAFVTNAKIKQQ